MEEQCYFCEEKDGDHLKGCYAVVCEKDSYKFPMEREQWRNELAARFAEAKYSNPNTSGILIVQKWAYEQADIMLAWSEN